MTMLSLLQKPFAKSSFKTYQQALLSAVALSPLLVTLLVNQNIQSPGLFFGGLLAYFIIFMTMGWRFEARRAQKFLHTNLAAKFSFGKAFAYAWLNILVGTFIAMLMFTWVITLIRNIFIYPFAEWQHSYPDLSWGGPTWQGAIALHTGSAILSLFMMPWFLAWLVGVQMAIIRRMLLLQKSQ